MSLYDYFSEKLSAIQAYFADQEEQDETKKSYWRQFLAYFYNSEEKKAEKTTFGKVFDLFKAYFVESDEKLVAWFYLIIMLVCVVAFVALMATMSWWNAGFWALLTAEVISKPLITASLYQFAGIVAGLVITYVAKDFFKELLAIRWRNWLTKKLNKELLDEHTYLKLNRFGIKDAAQIIQEDVPNLINLTLNLMSDFLNSVLSLGTFVSTLWVVGGALAIGTFALPGYLVWVALTVAILTTGITYYIGRSLAEINKKKESAEAGFRRNHETVHREAENIAQERAEPYHQKILDEDLTTINEASKEKLVTTTKISVFQSLVTNIGSVLPILLALPLLITGVIDLGQLMQIAMSYGQVSFALNLFGLSFESLSSLKASTDRTTKLMEAFKGEGIEVQEKTITRKVRDKDNIRIKGLNIMSHEKSSTELILCNFNAKFVKGENVVIMGQSGMGKTKIFHTIAGSHLHGEGKVSVPPDEDVLILPQNPTLPFDSLKGILAYPKVDQTIYEDHEYEAAIRRVAGKDEKFLNKLLAKLQDDKKSDWSKLSGGERQRISFARVFLQKPKFVILDESTSALDGENEDHIYSELQKEEETTFISVAHKTSVIKFHSKIIDLSRNKDENIKDVVVRTGRIFENGRVVMDEEKDRDEEKDSDVVLEEVLSMF